MFLVARHIKAVSVRPSLNSFLDAMAQNENSPAPPSNNVITGGQIPEEADVKERLATALRRITTHSTALERQLALSIIAPENDEHAAETIAKIEALASELLTVRTNFGTLLTLPPNSNFARQNRST